MRIVLFISDFDPTSTCFTIKMAAPPTVTLKDLTGAWVMNKTLSDDTDAVLALQGIGWLTRRAISWATITLHVKQYFDDKGITHIDIDQTVSGGINGTTELRELDWMEREHSDHLFGKLKGKSRWVELDNAEITDPFLKDGWEDGTPAGPNGEKFIQAWVVSEEKGWTADQIWGFAVVDGARYYVRRVVVQKGDTVLKVRLVYDWQK